jgi:VWFA-related protein
MGQCSGFSSCRGRPNSIGVRKMSMGSRMALAVLLAASSLCIAQAPKPSGSVPTIRSNARLVVVDVVAVDAHGTPVQGLKASDFSVLEDRKPQAIRGFDEHKSDGQPGPAIPQLKLPPNVFTNYIPPQSHGPVNILLFDLLNTEPAHLEFAKVQLVAFLRKLPPHQQFALFTLGTQLHMIQGFTENSDALITAANELSVMPNSVNKTVRQTAADIAETSIVKNPKMRASIIRFLLEEHSGHTDAQFSYTFDALAQLARAVAVIPGRKNLIWISDSLPFNFLPGSTIGRDYRDQLQRMGALLATTQIAVFPVDARGLATSSIDSSIGGKEAFRDTGGFADTQMSVINTAYQSMEAIAEQTGGKVFHNSNDLAGAVRSSADLGASYYTISYRPTNDKWNGDYRNISLKTPRKGLRLMYRSGYFAVADPLSSGKDSEQALNLSVQPFVPPSTALLMKAQVVPPAKESESTSIDVLLDPHDLAFTDVDKQKALALRFLIVAWDEKGKNCGSLMGNFDPQFQPAAFDKIMKTGIQVHQNLTLKSGTYLLRVGVADRNSGIIGTLDVPLTIPPAVSASTAH